MPEPPDKSTDSTIAEEQQTTGQEKDSDQSPSSRSSTPSTSSVSRSVSPLTPPPTQKTAKSNKRRKITDQEPNAYQLQLLGCLQSVAQPPPQHEIMVDEYDCFAKSIAEQIRKLSSGYLRAVAKKQIQDVLFTIEYGQQQPGQTISCDQPTYYNMG